MDTENSTEVNNTTTETNEVSSPSADTSTSSSAKPLLVKEPTLREEANKISSAIATSPLYPEVSYILHWSDPIRTGLLFGIFNFAFFLITYGEYSVVSLGAYSALALLVAAFAYANGSILFAKYIQGLVAENPLSSRWSNAEPIPRYVVEKHLDSVLNIVNAVLEVARDIFYSNFPILSVKAGVILLIISFIGKWFSGLTIIYTVTLISFIWPRLYQEKNREIDHYWKLATDHYDTYAQLALSKIPRLDKRKTQ